MSALPKGWVEVTLGEVFTLVRGLTYTKEDVSSDPKDGLVALLRANNIQEGRIDLDDVIYLPRNIMKDDQILRAGDIVLATSSGSRTVVGKAARITSGAEGTTFGAFCGVARPNSPDADQFLFQYMRSRAYREYVETVAIGTNINNFRTSDLQRMAIPLPPLAEQKRIVAKLDALNAKSARARTELARIETLVSRYKQTVLSKAFSGELTREWRQRESMSIVERTGGSQSMSLTRSSRVAKVGASIPEQRELVWNCPSSWRWDQVGNCAFVTKLAGFEYTKHVVYDTAGDLRVIKAENAGPDGFRQTMYSRIDSKSVSMLNRSELVGGELLVVFVGAGTGNVAVVPNDEKFFLGPNIAMARPDAENVSSAYLEKFFRSNGGKSLLLAATKAVAQPSLSMGAIRATPVALPPLEEQHEIVRRIESAFTKIDRLAVEAKRALALVGKLDEAILAKAFRGELVPQNDTDEPAEHLLARIRAEREAAPKARRGRRAGA